MNTGARIDLRECAPFFFDTFHERIARWPLNVEATIRASGLSNSPEKSVYLMDTARWWNIDGRFFEHF